MKKHLLIIAAALLALPALNSCNKPTGDPAEDAQACAGIIEDKCQLTLDTFEKMADHAEYYAENNKKDWKDFTEELDDLTEDINKDYEDQINDLKEKIKDVEDSMKDNDDEK